MKYISSSAKKSKKKKKKKRYITIVLTDKTGIRTPASFDTARPVSQEETYTLERSALDRSAILPTSLYMSTRICVAQVAHFRPFHKLLCLSR